MTEISNWEHRAGNKVVSAKAAVEAIAPGQRIFIGSGAAEPQSLVRALAERGSRLADTEILHLLTLGEAPYAERRFHRAFRHNALFIGANVRQAVAEGRADYTPVFLSEIPRLIRSRRLRVDVALIQVSPPDPHGFCSFGVSVDIVKTAAECAHCVIAEVNPRMPRTLGDSFIHLRDIDYLVASDTPLLVAEPGEPDDVSVAIGRHIAKLIDDGSTLQLGIGNIPNAVLEALGDKKHLGIHTEMFSDGVLGLIEAGIIDCREKTLLPGKVVSSFCFGSERLYRYIDNNPFFEFRPSEFTNDPFTIARNDKMVAINGALQVDLTGQVCADSLGHVFYSGIGGQVDFIRGAARSRGGKPIIAMPATAKGGTISRIVPHLDQGSGVVTTRGDVHFVVTEYGIADLWGKNVRERALALISIAHPKFREELLQEAKRFHLLTEDQILVPYARYPEELEREAVMKDGTRVLFRPVKPTDEGAMKDLFYACSANTIYQRFFTPIRAMPHDILARSVHIDYENEMVIVGFVEEEGVSRMIAAGTYRLDPATNFADVAFLVQDDYQGRGIGSFLMEYLIEIARSRGVAGFTADVLAENQSMLHVFYKTGLSMQTSFSDGVYHLSFRL